MDVDKNRDGASRTKSRHFAGSVSIFEDDQEQAKV